jgi:hypothetical protein
MHAASRLLVILCLLLPVSSAEQRDRINLKELLDRPNALQRVSLMWEYPPNAALYVYGDERLILQTYPVVSDPFGVMRNRGGLVPTCRAKINRDDIKALVDLMIERHFFDLPERGYIFMSAAFEQPKLELHTIAIDNGQDIAARTFGVGEYEGKSESLPSDFASIELALTKIKDSAFPSRQRPCGFADAIRFGK